MVIRDCMKREVISVEADATLQKAVRLLVEHHIGTLPVVDTAGKLVGLLQMRNLHELVMPDFVHLVENFDFVHNFGAVSARKPTPDMLNQPARKIMQKPISVDENCSLIRATAMLHSHRILDLPVVDREGRLVGIASRVDIGTAIMQDWC